MAVVTVVFNSFALVVLHRWRREFDDVSRIQYRSLAIANLVSGVLVGTFECMYSSPNSVSAAACIYVPFAYSFMVLNSTYHVALINLQRYLAVCYPFHYIRLVTVKRLTLLFISMEVLFFGISFVFSPGPGFPLTDFMTSWCRHRSIDYIEIDGATLGKSTFITFAVFGILFLIPFVSLTCMNIRLLVIATRASRQQEHVVSVGVRNDQESTNASSSTPGLKGLRTVLIITGLFYVSVIPVCVTFSAMASEASLSQQSYDILIFISNVVLMCSCWWNVPVYMSTSSLVSQRALELRKKWKCCKIVRHSNRIAYGDDLTLYNYSQTGLP
ncbi:trace amine-associated receptor 4-like [Strongylocentrotus purpuratus]|uniref:G-protein coupled receptors family 1 profile domain-containing protein n=1 Tax=Strongylocentrotus purpuratus TaxID=7668 RepID=A0A7M7HHK1_STRPU|nr:trace amine-associated receptor 4-like [Strongylocentrotus purpuratus]